MKLLPVAALLLLSACSSEGGNNSSTSAAAQPEAPQNLVEDPFNMASPYTPPSPSLVAALPARFDGRWTTLARNCASESGLLVVNGGTATLDGAPVTLGAIDTHGGDAITAHVAPPGQPPHDERWSVSGGGRQLVRQTTDPTKAIIYSRCPA